KRGIWFIGPSSSRSDDGTISYLGVQDDLATITRPGNFISYRGDDYGSVKNSGSFFPDPATGDILAEGVLENNGDQGAFTFNAVAPVVQFTVSNATYGGMLAPNLELIPLGLAAGGNVTVTTSNTSATLNATNVTPDGEYLLRVSRQGTGYGSIGQY